MITFFFLSVFPASSHFFSVLAFYFLYLFIILSIRCILPNFLYSCFLHLSSSIYIVKDDLILTRDSVIYLYSRIYDLFTLPD